MAETETTTVRVGAKVKFANVVGGIFDREYRVHIPRGTCVILADWETGRILREKKGGKPREVPIQVLNVVL